MERANRRDSGRQRPFSLGSSKSFAQDDRLRLDKWEIPDYSTIIVKIIRVVRRMVTRLYSSLNCPPGR